MSDGSGSNVPCVVDKEWYPHLFLVPAGIILTILAFLRRRTSFKRDVWRGRPGIVVPIDFLGIDHDRLTVMFVFGAATGMILNLIINRAIGRNVWETAFLGIGTAMEIAFLYYPYFACLASYHRIIGAMMGLPYVTVFFALTMASNLQECNDNDTWIAYLLEILPNIPTIVCQLFILGKFVFVLYKEIKENYETCALRLFSNEEEEQSAVSAKLTRPWLSNHVKNLVNSRVPRTYTGIWLWLRKIYNPEKNFKFSTLTLSVVMICFIILYYLSIQVLFLASLYLEKIREASAANPEQDFKLFRGFFNCILAAGILAGFFCIISLIRFMENHKNNMLQMFRGDKSFMPKTITTSQFMIGKGLRYHSYQIGYFIWGYLLLLLVFLCICGAVFALSYPFVMNEVLKFVKGGGVVAGVAVLAGLSLPLASFTVFRDYSYSKNVISINNRNVYLLFSYFWFFVGLPMGFFSAISRILKAMLVGALMLPRIDDSVLPGGFQRFDQGFMAYIGYLHVQAAYRNPVLRVFCQILCDETRSTGGQKWRYSAKARSRWFLALTLARNLQLAGKRKGVIQADTPMQATALRSSMVEVEIVQFGSDDSRLIKKM